MDRSGIMLRQSPRFLAPLSFLFFLSLSAAFGALTSSAPLYAAATVHDEKDEKVWPQPPDAPKIKYLNAFRSVRDLGGPKDAADAIEAPYGVAVGTDGRIYVTSRGSVAVFDRKRRSVGFIGRGEGPGKLTGAVGVAVTKDDRIFVADAATRAVFRYASDGTYTGPLGSPGELESPGGIAVDEGAKRIYVTDMKKHRIAVYSSTDNRMIRTIGGRGTSGEGKFNFPTNLAVDTKGNLYVADTGNFRVQVFDRDGRFVRSIGKLGSLPGFFARPKGLAVDSENHLYVVDAAFQNVQVFDADGRLLLFFGAGGWGPGLFTLPAGIAIDGRDRIYVVDQWPGNVQMFQYLGEQDAKR